MSIKLYAHEKKIRDEIVERMDKARKAMAESRIDDQVRTWIMEAGKLAHELHKQLKIRGHEPQHHKYMIKNRGMNPNNPEFYMHFHPIEDLLKFLDDEHANDDPEDQTIGAKFTFKVFSNRFSHEDTYAVERTELGWKIVNIAIGGPCDKGGNPFLYMNFRQDSIQYPAGLEGWMEWLWKQAAEEGLTQKQVQDGLNQLADWVSKTEKNTPKGGVWKGY